MEKLFISFSKCFLLDNAKEGLEELKKEAGKQSGKYQKKASRFSKKLKKDAQKLGFDVDFESFCSMLQNYVNIKDSLEDKEKKEYLEILTKLSLIHDVNLREELDKYISYKAKEPDDEESKIIFHKFCRYYLNKENTVEDYNVLKELAKQYNIDFQEYQENAMSYVEKIKNNAEEVGLFTEERLFNESVNKYLTNKQEMDDQRKSEYLRVLAALSEIYEINLRELLTPKVKKVEEEPKELSNPLDNDEALKELLRQRYNNGSFEIRELSLEGDSPRESSEFDYLSFQAKLIHQIIGIFLDKINNYCTDDLNEEISNLTEENYEKLSELTEENIYNYLNDNYELDDYLIDFINFAITTTDLRTEHIGTNELSLFKTNDDGDKYTIYLNGPERETVNVLNEYIKRCIKENVSYNMTGLWSGKEYKDRSLLYASDDDLRIKISILDKIKKDHPSWIDSFGSPIYSSSTNGSYYGISLTDINDIPYNDFFNSVCEVAYYRTIAKIAINKIEKEIDKEIINDFIDIDDYVENKPSLPEYATFGKHTFREIKDLINSYIPEITKTLNIYMEEQIDTLEKEFKKSILYIFNCIYQNDKKEETNIALNNML